jgi:hypothetical protein
MLLTFHLVLLVRHHLLGCSTLIPILLTVLLTPIALLLPHFHEEAPVLALIIFSAQWTCSTVEWPQTSLIYNHLGRIISLLRPILLSGLQHMQQSLAKEYGVHTHDWHPLKLSVSGCAHHFYYRVCL